MTSFADLSLLPSLLGTLAELGLTEPTRVQREAIPPQLAGRGVVAVSETGSGKTLAFALPMLHQLKALEAGGDAVDSASRPRGLVLVPGRELGEQVCKVFKSLTHDTRLRVRSVLGGTKKQRARQNVGGMFEVLVATPGRLQQFLDSGELRLDDLRALVLDEADSLLAVDFLPVVRQVVAASPASARLALFAATFPAAYEETVAQLFGGDPVRVRSGQALETLTTINRNVTEEQRFEALGKVLAQDPEVPTLLFANTRQQCERLAAWLGEQGVAFGNYRGQMDATERRQSLAAFRRGELRLLVTTDLGGRGLDLEGLERVINVFLPQDLEDYLHRAGRTARAGRPGTVVNLVTKRDLPLLRQIQGLGRR
ncbi:MAG: DEAD/DEAH box helicase [Planctomycetota bacterium]